MAAWEQAHLTSGDPFIKTITEADEVRVCNLSQIINQYQIYLMDEWKPLKKKKEAFNVTVITKNWKVAVGDRGKIFIW